MKYPTLAETGAKRELADIFGGLDVNDRAVVNGWAGYGRRDVTTKWAWTENASCDKYPSASTRARRRINGGVPYARAFSVIKDESDTVKTVAIGYDETNERDHIYVNGAICQSAFSSYSFTHSSYPKNIVQLGRNIYVLNSSTQDTDKAKRIRDSFGAVASELEYALDTSGLTYASNYNVGYTPNIRYSACDENGNKIAVRYTEDGTHTETSAYYVDREGSEGDYSYVLKRYSAAIDGWVVEPNGHIKIEVIDPDAPKITDRLAGISAGDYITIKNAECMFTGESDTAKDYNNYALSKLSANAVEVVAKGGGDAIDYPFIVVKAAFPIAHTLVINEYWCQTASQVSGATKVNLTVKKSVPVFDHVCAGENRIWGCNSNDNEIRCCKLGDPGSWVTDTTATGAYAVTVGGEQGKFTGAAFAFGCPVFFKEHAVIRINGTAPANYRLTSISAPGVEASSARSVAVVNDIVFYLSPNGVCAYDGANVNEIGAAIGGGIYKNGVGAGANGKYYLSCESKDGSRHMFVYDVRRGTWIREDATRALYGDAVGNAVVFLEQTGETEAETRIISNRADAPIFDAAESGGEPTPGTAESAFDFELVTPVIGYESPDEKYLSRFNLRLLMEAGARLDVYVKYDGSDEWEHKTSLTAFGRKSFTMPIRPRRCDHMQIRFAGHGDCVIYSFAKIYENGSDVVR